MTPPAPVAAAAAPTPAAPRGPAPPLPPAPAPWDLQLKVSAQSDAVVRAVQGAGLRGDTTYGRMAERMIRAALLDPKAYRDAAQDEAGTTLAFQAVALVYVAMQVSGLLFGRSLTLSSIVTIATMIAAQLVSFTAGVFLISWAAPKIAKVPLTFGQLFRPLAYAQSPGLLGLVPGIGQLLSLWQLATTVAALREVTACDAAKAVVLMLIGFVGSLVAAAVVTPIALSVTRAFLGGF